ncbi:heparan-alpha-glucosaminide N-acetyltransferase domain-containing protein [Nesterenkonia muleiensis]|uniref:heparan-alpha-glucosaminide N-acetyltransferase domain-containing protein n=1 Tax=Nesterenkonia muleiensis TaxID=2282648 RepID=UPI000E747C1A|nr:heparan-alpha-glucosaminide N-acetyltransferase domain-containing protein [Nesterenkonia muleiensis]
MRAAGTNTVRGGRLWGVDAARGLALLGMMTVHVLPTTDPGTGEATWAGMLFSGRSAALFAVLAGVGLALLTGGSSTEARAQRRADLRREGRRKPSERRAVPAPAAGTSTVAVRAAVIIGIGLVVSMLGAGVAVILVHYGVLFLLALPFLRLGARALFGLAAAWVAAAPLLYWWVQNLLRPSAAEPPERLWHSPMIFDLANPGLLTLDLFVTGYYPLILWPAYLFAGMAMGRLDLTRTATALRVFGVGLIGAVLTYWIGWFTIQRSGVAERMRPYADSEGALAGALETGDHLLPLVTDPLWFLIPMAHQGSHLDLLHTISCAAAVLGLCLLSAQLLNRLRLQWVLAPLAGAGAMPLSLYVGHLIVLGPFWRMEDAPLASVAEETMIFWLVVAALAAGTVKVLLRRRGPLEALTHMLSTGTS